MKFPVGTGVGEVRGDQQAARNCYAVSTNPATLAKQCAHVTSEPSQGAPEQDHYILDKREVPDIIVEEPEEEEREWASGHPADQLEEISVKGEDQTKVVKIGGGLDPETRKTWWNSSGSIATSSLGAMKRCLAFLLAWLLIGLR